jgi:hypothetical protein
MADAFPAARWLQGTPTEEDFLALVKTRIEWSPTRNRQFPWRVVWGRHRLEIEFGDWPTTAAFTLHVDGKPVLELAGWPEAWITRKT